MFRLEEENDGLRRQLHLPPRPVSPPAAPVEALSDDELLGPAAPPEEGPNGFSPIDRKPVPASMDRAEAEACHARSSSVGCKIEDERRSALPLPVRRTSQVYSPVSSPAGSAHGLQALHTASLLTGFPLPPPNRGSPHHSSHYGSPLASPYASTSSHVLVQSMPPPSPVVSDRRSSGTFVASYSSNPSNSDAIYFPPAHQSSFARTTSESYSPVPEPLTPDTPTIMVDLKRRRSIPTRNASPSRVEEVQFLQAYCGVVPGQLDSPFAVFCLSLMRGLEHTGKGAAGRLSFTNEELRKHEGKPCCGGVVSCDGLFEDREDAPLPPGYMYAFAAWDMIQPLLPYARPEDVANRILDFGALAPTTNGPLREASLNVRCFFTHGLVVAGLIVDSVVDGPTLLPTHEPARWSLAT